VNRDDLPFRLISGLVDADRFHDGGINFGVLPKGTRAAQCLAVLWLSIPILLQIHAIV
jgi:hypothetical protein